MKITVENQNEIIVDHEGVSRHGDGLLKITHINEILPQYEKRVGSILITVQDSVTRDYPISINILDGDTFGVLDSNNDPLPGEILTPDLAVKLAHEILAAVYHVNRIRSRDQK